MLTFTTKTALRAWRTSLGGSLGLVPTMGALHAGHLSLLAAARRQNTRVAVSLFVNPLQFGPHEDFARYPRDLAADRRLLESSGCDALFAPSVDEMIPPGCATTVDVGPLALPLEGQRRPGHFRGVATIVTKLLAIARPDRAYFGEKDAQQLAVIQRLVSDLDLPVQVCPCPVVRESDGLAMSSRNAYLTADERAAAPVLWRAMEEASRVWAGGERRGDRLEHAMRAVLDAQPLARTDYAVAVDPTTLEPIDRAHGPVRLLLAVFLGGTRLIDTRLLG